MPTPAAPGIHAALGAAAAALILIVTVGVAPARTEARTGPPAVSSRTAPPPARATSAAEIAALAVTVVSPTTYPVVAAAATTPISTATTLPSIRNRIPVPPSTVPLQTRALSTHISPVFSALSGAGFFVALVMMATRFVMTRPRRRK